MAQHAFRRWGWSSLLLLVFAISACTIGGDADTDDLPRIFEGAPVITISSPAPNATYLQGTDVNILARIENAGEDIARVEITLDDLIIGQGENPNPMGAVAFTITNSWTATLTGQHRLTVSAIRADGTTGSSQVVINVRPVQTSVEETSTEQATGGDTVQQPQPTLDLPTPVPVQASPTPPPTQVQAPTTPPEPTAIPPTATPSVPTARIIQGANVRGGPATSFPAIGSFAANETTQILARNPAGDWYKVRYYNGEGWVFAQLVEVTGNVTTLPTDAGPPTPVPVPPTDVPTEVPVSNINLVVTDIQVSPHPMQCGQASTINVTVANNGTQGTNEGGLVRVQAVLADGGQVQAETFVPFPALAAGESATVSAPLTVTTNINAAQDIRATVDYDNRIPESNETDNTLQGARFVLGQGSC